MFPESGDVEFPVLRKDVEHETCGGDLPHTFESEGDDRGAHGVDALPSTEERRVCHVQGLSRESLIVRDEVGDLAKIDIRVGSLELTHDWNKDRGHAGNAVHVFDLGT